MIVMDCIYMALFTNRSKSPSHGPSFANARLGKYEGGTGFRESAVGLRFGGFTHTSLMIQPMIPLNP